MKQPEIYVILHNVRSVHNVGSVFRTADAVGVSKIFLTGYTPSPEDRFGRPRKDISKTALGAELSVPWKSYLQVGSVLRNLSADGVKIIAVEQSPKAKNYSKLKISDKTAFIFGNEVAGLSGSILKKADEIVELPMRGKKESLNVSVAAGVVLFKAFENRGFQ